MRAAASDQDARPLRGSYASIADRSPIHAAADPLWSNSPAKPAWPTPPSASPGSCKSSATVNTDRHASADQPRSPVLLLLRVGRPPVSGAPHPPDGSGCGHTYPPRYVVFTQLPPGVFNLRETRRNENCLRVLTASSLRLPPEGRHASGGSWSASSAGGGSSKPE